MKWTLRLIAPLLLAPCIAHGLEISGLSGIVIDAGSGKVLWEKDAHAKRFPASTTKVLTALLLVERTQPDEIITAPPEIESVKQASMHLKPGERIRSKDLLYGMMLRSANDGAYAAAIHMSGTIPAFSALMNERAKQAGCTDSHFNNPNGLNDPHHFTSAHDLAFIARDAMRYPEFCKAVKTWKMVINRSLNYKDRTMVNRNKWLLKDPTADGIKTGWTVPAGHCYVGSATRNGFRVITAIMKSDNWQQDHSDMLDFAFANFEKRNPMPAGVPVGSVVVPTTTQHDVPVAPRYDAYVLVRKGDDRPIQSSIVVEPGVVAPIKKGQRVATMVVVDPDGQRQEIPLEATTDVEASPSVVVRAAGSPSFLIFGSALVCGVVWVRGRAKRAARKYATKTSRTKSF